MIICIVKRAILFTAMYKLSLSKEDMADHTLKTVVVLRAEKYTFLLKKTL